MILLEAPAEPGIPPAGFVVGGLFAAAMLLYGIALVADVRSYRTNLSTKWTAALDRSRVTGAPMPALAPIFAYRARAYGIAMLVAGALMTLLLVALFMDPGPA